jgi:hypothetical protein
MDKDVVSQGLGLGFVAVVLALLWMGSGTWQLGVVAVPFLLGGALLVAKGLFRPAD